MKKLLCLLLAMIAMLGCFSGCAAIESFLGPSDKTFTKDKFSITLNEDFYEKEYISYYLYFESADVLVTVVKDNFADIQAAGISTDISMKDYMDLVILGNEIEGASDVVETEGLTYFTYEAEVDGDKFFYTCYAVRGEDAFYLVDMAGFADKKDDLTPKFEKWAKTITIG